MKIPWKLAKIYHEKRTSKNIATWLKLIFIRVLFTSIGSIWTSVVFISVPAGNG